MEGKRAVGVNYTSQAPPGQESYTRYQDVLSPLGEGNWGSAETQLCNKVKNPVNRWKISARGFPWYYQR